MSTYQPADYEYQLIGAAMTSPDLAVSLTDTLAVQDFMLDESRAMWAAIVKSSHEPEKINAVDVAEAAGLDIAFVAEVARMAYSREPAVVNSWRDVIKKKAKLDRIGRNFQSLIEDCRQPGADADEIAQRAAGYVLSLEQAAELRQKRSRREVLHERLNALSDRWDGLVDPIGLRTGIGELDEMIFGLKPSELTLLAARPAMGKTALAMQISRINALCGKSPVLLFSLEMDADELYDRWLVQQASVDAGQFQRGKGMPEFELSKVSAAATVLSESALHAYDDIHDIEGIVSKCEAVNRREGGIGLIVVDYLQLIGTRGHKPNNRAQEVGEYSRALKLLAMRMKCPVLALSQLNRDVENRSDKRPMMADLRESGSLEQDANKIIMLYRDEVYHEHSNDRGVAELIVRKHRGGPTGTVRCLAEMNKFSFHDITPDRVRQQADRAGVDAFA